MNKTDEHTSNKKGEDVYIFTFYNNNSSEGLF